jgi:hypothetical protein
LDLGFTSSASGLIRSVVLQGDQKIPVGGYFIDLCGQARNGVGRLKPDGSLDSGFNAVPISGSGSTALVRSLALQSDGQLRLGRIFNTVGTAPRRENIARLGFTALVHSSPSYVLIRDNPSYKNTQQIRGDQHFGCHHHALHRPCGAWRDCSILPPPFAVNGHVDHYSSKRRIGKMIQRQNDAFELHSEVEGSSVLSSRRWASESAPTFSLLVGSIAAVGR